VQVTLVRASQIRANYPDQGRVSETAIARAKFATIIAFLFAALHAVLAITAAMQKSPTFDEPTHLTAGYSYWLKNDYRLDPENGNLPARWAALPLLWSRPVFPENGAWDRGDVGRVSENFIYRSGNDSDQVILQGRSMMAIVGAGLCLLIFFFSARLFGPVGGLISELLAVFDPNLLAHSALITADVTAAFFFVAAAWSYFRLLNAVNVRWFLITGLSWSGLFLAKMSAPAFLFVAAILVAVRLCAREPLPVHVWGVERRIKEFWRKLILVSGLTGALLPVVVLAIWASFEFRFSPFPQDAAVREVWNARWEACLSDHSGVEKMVGFARNHKLLPEAYLYGFAFTSKSAMFRPTFLDGEWSATGFPSFFARAFLYKTPIPILMLLIAAAVAGYLRWRTAFRDRCRCILAHDLASLAPVWALVLVYGLFSLTSHLNIGHRHLLPIYPAIFVVCGACAYFLHARLIMTIFAGTMLCWQIAESALLRPDYLAYFNQIAGGPKNGYKHLVDSSLDWGQDLPALKTWLDQHPNQPSTGRLYLAYFGAAVPQYYGIEATGLPFDSSADKLPAFEPGRYCISATTLQRVYSFEHGKWTREYESAYRLALAREVHHFDLRASDSVVNSALLQRLRFGRLCAYLRKREPIANVGNSILVFQLNQRELDQALHGPPVELASSF
jgi:Dolichyl-phosphate-mannose-protein mannosyltransferase